MKKLITVCQAIVIVAVISALLLFVSSAHSATWVSCSGDTFCGGGVVNHSGTVDLATGQSPPNGAAHVWRYTFPIGVPVGDGIADVWAGSPSGTEMWGQWDYKYSPGYMFNGIENKQFYFNPSNVEGVVFTPYAGVAVLPQGPNTNRYDPNVNTSLWYMDSGVWHRIKVHYVLNTGNQYNGIFQAWIDDVMVSNHSDVYYLTGSANLSGTVFAVIYGGMGGTIPQTQYLYLSNIYLGNTEPGGAPAVDLTSPYADTFSPGNGATGTPVGTTSFSFHFKDAGINYTGADSASLTVNCSGFGGVKTCASGLTCSGTSADYTVMRSGLSLGYDNVVSCSIYGEDLASPPNTMNQNYSFTVQPSTNPALSISTASMPNGTKGSVYSGGPLVATGGHSPYTWVVLAGTFPPGMSLSPSGVPTGTPTTTGTFSFTVRATDALGATADKAFSVIVYPAIPVTTSAADNTDTFINSGSPTVNYADNTWLETYVWPTVPANIILVKRTTSGIADNQVVTSYVYRLYLTGKEGSGGTNPLPHQYGPVTGIFAIDNVTWTNFTGTYGTAVGTVNVGLIPGWFDFDVTALAQAAYANGKSTFSFYISPYGGVQDSNRIFASSSYADNTLRPQSIITTVPIAMPPGTVSPPTPPTPSPPPASPSGLSVCRVVGSNCMGTGPGGANFLGAGINYIQ